MSSRGRQGAIAKAIPLRNPTNQKEWPSEPASLEELEQQWIPATRRALLTWLQEARNRATQNSDLDKIKPCKQALDAEWSNWVKEADLETGTMKGGTVAATDCEAAMLRLQREYQKVHSDLSTDHKHDEYRYAQIAWEDFLYFQNEWNRRYLEVNKIYYETRQEAASAKRADPILYFYQLWRDHLWELYTKFGLGNRNSSPKSVTPDVAHRYSQPPRGTTSTKLKAYRIRSEQLKLKFPGADSRIVDLDKLLTTNIQRNPRATEWIIDQDIFTLEQEEKDRSYLQSPTTKALLPTGHDLHHGVLETSFDWPTSFDADEWGNVIAVTANKRDYVYEEEEYQTENGKTDRRYKKDGQGRPIRLTETCGYIKEKHKKESEVFIHDLNEDGSVVGRDRGGVWVGRFGTATEIYYKHVLKNRKKIPDIRYRSKFQFKIVKTKSKWKRVTRYQRHLQSANGRLDTNGNTLVDQLSDDEAVDCIKSNLNFCRSGNVQSDSDPQKARPVVIDNGSHSSDDDSSGESDEDLFAISYRECSGSVSDHARILLVKLKYEIGRVNPRWTYRDVLKLVAAGALDEEVQRIYRETYTLPSTYDYSSEVLISATRQLMAWEKDLGNAGWTVSYVAAKLSGELEPDEGDLESQYQARLIHQRPDTPSPE
ncbi:hypothetical protein C7974DRAFT_423395 [Boeremia exigua]|uniref:uncharacterized protein n=1 Tax=Boeremia exigua TaxID=749465 RepID=UPI001E8EE72B|nr:uncharacterized protein C7974DRAFT_423395 [Boeremia exigua]KAH6632944.1 hypothetical protein C7974DRAFT_423395 [Boeremia exigua]